MQMDEGLDTGDMIHKVIVPIAEDDDRLLLQEKLADAGVQALIHVLDNFSGLAPAATRQDDSMSTYARKMGKIEALINWDQAADLIDRQVRAGLGRSPAYSFLGEGRVQILKAASEFSSHSLIPGTIVNARKDVLSVACRDSVLQIKALQFAGKNSMEIAAALNSHSALFKPGNRFTSDVIVQS
jgi:methionyl-tRNA formyltransferase